MRGGSSMRHAQSTSLQPEEYAYPNGSLTRQGRAVLRQNPHNPIVLPYGEVRAVRAGIPDTFFSIPARLRYRGRTIAGFLTCTEGTWEFTPEADPRACTACAQGDGCKG